MPSTDAQDNLLFMGPSLREIATLASCSVCTASKALRGDPRISQATRQRVRDVATSHGYRPCPALSRVAGRRARTRPATGEPLAFLLSTQGRGRVTRDRMDWFLIDGARQRAAELGYALEVHAVEDFSSATHLDRTLFARGIQGILLGSFLGPHPSALDLQWDRYTAVWLGRACLPLHFPVVRLSYFQAVRNAVAGLAASGCTRIGVFLDASASPRHEHDAQQGAALLASASPPPGTTVASPIDLPFTEENLPAIAPTIRGRGFDGVLVREVASYWLLKRAGFDIPADLRAAVVYLPETADRWSAEVSGIPVASRRIGHEAVNVVDSALRHGLFGERTDTPEVVLPTTFLSRASLGTPPAAHAPPTSDAPPPARRITRR